MKIHPTHLRCVALAALVSAALLSVSRAAETTYAFTSVDIGDPKPGSTTELSPGKDFEIRGFGSQFGGHKNFSRGRFVYTKLKGDFDITVQVRALENEDRDLTHPLADALGQVVELGQPFRDYRLVVKVDVQ